MTRVLLAVACATLLATSSARADVNSLKQDGDRQMLVVEASAPSTSTQDGPSDREHSAEVRKTSIQQTDREALSPWGWIGEKIIVAIGSVVCKPVAGSAFSVGH
jgi:hypothetical protein